MPLSSGDKLGPYEILAPIGKGGMGEVYRAKDTKLDREVAIKVLPSALAQDSERLARFEREAKVLASLNHPNIAQIYGIEESSTSRALVMELVPGGTLAGTLPLETALNYAKQIAEALEAAHDKNIIHRDLKPANIMVTPAGVIKVLDFGLAAVTRSSAVGNSDPSNSPTLTMGATQAGMILGTAGYMAPEQAAGQVVDKRADIWAFGVVLFEMLTGQRLFTGDSVAHILADVLRAPIDFEKLPAATPRVIRDLLRRCLDRDVNTRLRDIGEARIAIQNTGKEAESSSSTAAAHGYLPWIIAAAATAVALLLGFVSYRHVTEEPAKLVQFFVPPPESGFVDTTAGSSIALSPDGNHLAFVARVEGKTAVWVRDFSALVTRQLPGTEGALGTPFWSPDSRLVAFFDSGKLKKIDIGGGPVVLLCDAIQGRSGTWSGTGVIVFQINADSRSARLFRVSASGGAPIPLNATEAGEAASRFPSFLPDGNRFLYTVISSNKKIITGVYLGDLQSGGRRLILREATNAVYAPPGYIVFMSKNILMAQPFDATIAQISGEPVLIADQVDYSPNNARGQFSISSNGVLAYLPSAAESNQMEWYDRSGKSLGRIGSPGDLFEPSISPDEKFVAFRRNSGTGSDLWIRDLTRGTETRFTSEPSFNIAPVWSPRGDRIVFASNRKGAYNLYQKAIGSGNDELLSNNPTGRPTQWSRDGRFIVFQASDPKTQLWVLPIDGPSPGRKPFQFLKTEFLENLGQISPDSHWMAFTSGRSVRPEVFVRPFPEGEGEWAISSGEGYAPRWRGDGKEMFFVTGGKMMAVPVKANPGGKAFFDPGPPVELFDAHIVPGLLGTFPYDVTADGKRFLIDTKGGSGAVSPPVTVVMNWQVGMKK